MSIAFPVLMMLACGPKTSQTDSLSDAPAPILPSPNGFTYATGPSTPTDPIVAEVVATGLPWQESLAGAATGVALAEPFHAHLSSARWAGVRAGYPYMIHSLIVGRVDKDTYPTDLLSQISPALGEDDEIGIVRARVGTDDLWVALIAQPVVRLEPFPKQIDIGETLEVDAIGVGNWVLTSPTGEHAYGAMPVSHVVDESGEWFLEIFRAEDVSVAAMPIYVGVPAPPAPTIDLPGVQTDTPASALDVAHDLINTIRTAHGLVQLRSDETLEVLADHPLTQVLDGTWNQTQGENRLRGAGFVGGPVGQIQCSGETVAICLDNVLWTSRSRQALLQPGLRISGGAAQVTTDGLTLVFNLTSE